MATLFARLLPRRSAMGAAVSEPLADYEEEAGHARIEEEEVRRMVELSGMTSFDPESLGES